MPCSLTAECANTAESNSLRVTADVTGKNESIKTSHHLSCSASWEKNNYNNNVVVANIFVHLTDLFLF